jgi:hypothetical protein
MGGGDAGAICGGLQVGGAPRRSTDLFHWSAMEVMEHWRQRLSVALGRGRARCLEDAAVVAATWDVDPAREHL